MKFKSGVSALVFCVCLFALAAMVQGLTVNGKKIELLSADHQNKADIAAKS